MVLEENADSLIYATFIGGPISTEHVDGGTSRFSKKGMIYQSVCAGCGNYDDFPTTTGAWSNTNNSNNCNNAVFKFDFELSQTVADFDLPPIGCYPVQINITNNSSDAINYTWLINNIVLSSNANFSYDFTNPGTYEVTLIANNPLSCNQTDTVTKIIEIGSNSTQYLNDLYVCNNENIQVGFQGSEDPSITYSWTPPGFVSDPGIANPVATPQGDVSLILTVSQYSCTDTFYQNIYNNYLNIGSSGDFTICQGDTAVVYATSYGTPCTYTWSTSPDFSSPFSTDSVFIANPDDTLTYFCLIQSNYCTDTAQVSVNVSSVDIIAEAGFTICSGDSVQLNAVGNNLSENLYFDWQPLDSILSGEHTQSPVISIDDTTLFVVSATNSAGCSDTDSILVSISDFSLSTYDIIIPLYDTIYQYQTLQINTVTGTAFSYQWNPETWLDNPHSSDPIASPLVTTSYYVYVTDSFGCLRIDSFTVFVLDILCNDVYVFVPNAFSPNNDQVNDILYIQSYLVKDLYFVIFDRWGEKVFETTDVSKGWDGRYKGKLLDPAVFVYYMKATCMNDVVFEKKGNITLLR